MKVRDWQTTKALNPLTCGANPVRDVEGTIHMSVYASGRVSFYDKL